MNFRNRENKHQLDGRGLTHNAKNIETIVPQNVPTVKHQEMDTLKT